MIWAVVTLFAAAVSAEAQDDPPYLLEYRAYNEALQRGDAKAAEGHARAAWESAEELRGDDRITAILAYNYGRQSLFANSSQALVAMRRAGELRDLAGDALPSAALDLYRAYLELVTGENNRRNAKALREALAAEEDVDAMEFAAMSLGLALKDFAAGRMREAEESAATAKAAILKADPQDTVGIATAGITKGAAQMLRQPRREQRIRAAQEEFRKVRDLYPPQADIESFAVGLAQALAWDYAAAALLQSMGERAGDLSWDRDSPLFERPAGLRERCGDIEWVSRSPPSYPRDAVRKGYVGAVLVGYHIDDALGIEGVRILAEVPAAKFGDAALEAVANWEIESMENDAEHCRRNRVTRFRFVIS